MAYICQCVYIDVMDSSLFFDLLGDATRRRILALLKSEGELCVCELTEALGQIQPKVSRHLAVIREAGVVCVRREGTWSFYRLHESLPAWVSELLATLTTGAVPELAADRRRLKIMATRPVRCAA